MSERREKVGTPRRSNEDRTAETRARLLEATVECLNRSGYAGTTVGLVSEVSGITRGGLLHHFPSKAELLIATAEYCLDNTRSASLSAQKDVPRRSALLKAMQGSAGIALMEIMVGSRSDPELRTRFADVANKILLMQKRNAALLAEQSGVVEDERLHALVWLNMAAIRGMMLMELAGLKPGLNQKAMDILRRAQEVVVDDLLKEQPRKS